MPNSEGLDQPQKTAEASDNNVESSKNFIAELTPSTPTDLGSITLNPKTNNDGNGQSGSDFLEIPHLGPDNANDGTHDLTIENGEDLGYKHPIADLAEEYEGKRPHLETGMMAGVQNPAKLPRLTLPLY